MANIPVTLNYRPSRTVIYWDSCSAAAAINCYSAASGIYLMDKMRTEEAYEQFEMVEKAFWSKLQSAWRERERVKWYGHVRRKPAEIGKNECIKILLPPLVCQVGVDHTYLGRGRWKNI